MTSTQRQQIVAELAARLANVSDMPDWYRVAAWGQDATPIAEIVIGHLEAMFGGQVTSSAAPNLSQPHPPMVV